MPLPDEMLTILSAHAGLGHRGEWLFAGAEDNPPHQNTVGYWWRKALNTAGLDRIKLHDLRHFYASGLIAAGCDVVTVQRALGHARRYDYAEHLLAPVALGGGQDAQGGRRSSRVRSSALTGARRGQERQLGG